MRLYVFISVCMIVCMAVVFVVNTVVNMNDLTYCLFNLDI